MSASLIPGPRPDPAARSHLRLVGEPTQDRQQAWYTRADRDLRLFLLRQGHRLADPSLAHWVVEQCAELSWEWRKPGQQADWAALRVTEVWIRLANLHRFFPQPRLVVAYYETLQLFLPWLAADGQLPRTVAMAMLEQLDFVRSPMLERARSQLVARQRFRTSTR